MFTPGRLLKSGASALRGLLPLALVLLLPVAFWLVARSRRAAPVSPARTPGTRARFVGSESCRDCHREVVDRYAATPHALTSTAVTRGEFGPLPEGARAVVTSPAVDGNYLLEWRGDDLVFRHERRGGGGAATGPSLEIAYVIGSGRQGISLAARAPNSGQLVQVPVSYYADLKRWGISPGFNQKLAEHGAHWLRPIPHRCWVCHVTYLGPIPSKERSVNVLGVGCEKCHGPGETHVETWRSRRKDGRSLPARGTVVDPTIVNPARLPIDLQMEICAECHGPELKVRADKEFRFRPGQRLHESYEVLPQGVGEQHTEAQSLVASLCFQRASRKQELACGSCHDPHRAVVKGLANFNLRCRSCHQEASRRCKFVEPDELPSANCVQCHMPEKGTGFGHGSFRNHRIAVYRSSEIR